MPYAQRHADAIAAWTGSAREREMWASSRAEITPETLRSWSEAPGVSAFVFLDDGEPCAYAELWEDHEAAEAELAHIIVAPPHRRRGVARAVLAALVAEARSRGFADVWMRVFPENAGALACYERAGFLRASGDEERRFNAGQPHAYVWMRAPVAPMPT